MMRIGCVSLSLLWLLSGAGSVSAADAGAARHVEEEIVQLARDLAAALESRDRAAIERCFAPEFVFIHAFGYIDTRAEHVEALLARQPTRRPRLPTFTPPASLRVFADVAVHQHPGVTNLGTPAVVTTIYARGGGGWRVLRTQATEMVPEREAVSLEPEILEAYVGRYERGDGVIVEIVKEGAALLRVLPGFPKVRLWPASESRFFDKVGGEWSFHREGTGPATRFVHRFRGREWSGIRLSSEVPATSGAATSGAVRRKTTDVLFAQVPWNVSVVLHSWMTEPVPGSW